MLSICKIFFNFRSIYILRILNIGFGIGQRTDVTFMVADSFVGRILALAVWFRHWLSDSRHHLWLAISRLLHRRLLHTHHRLLLDPLLSSHFLLLDLLLFCLVDQLPFFIEFLLQDRFLVKARNAYALLGRSHPGPVREAPLELQHVAVAA